jgi:TM2 domain-containing membrane protein YozV
MLKRIAFLFLLFLCIAPSKKAAAAEQIVHGSGFYLPVTNLTDTTALSVNELNSLLIAHPATLAFIRSHAENKKLVALILTATLGMLGVHRLYLGTKPWIPAIYLFTFGGCFFILPFIDFVVLLISKDISKFENNNKVFMWAN